jgi:hypothetical protein
MQLSGAPPTTYSEAGHGEITQCEEGTAYELHAIRIAWRAARDKRERARRERTQRRGTEQWAPRRGKP